MSRAVAYPLLVAALLTCAASAHAQAGRTCEVQIDSTGGIGRQVTVGGGWVHHFANGGIWAHCIHQVARWFSDSVAWYQERNRLDLVRRVRFRDETVELTSDRASYFLTDERLEAYGNAVLRNRRTGSVLRGPRLVYRRAAPGVRDEAEWEACERPTIEYRAEVDTAPADPYIIVAQCVRLEGETAAYAAGAVTIDRSDFTARADSGTLDTGAGAGRLIGHARVTGGERGAFTLTGRQIAYRITAGALTWAQAEGDGDATSDEWRIVADTIQFDLTDGRVERGSAWGSDSLLAQAISLRQTIVADSLAIAAPGQQLSEVRGVGTARATSRVDSLDLGEDWVVGDTVIARFDTTDAGQRVLAQLDAFGNARARYRVFPELGNRELPDISYSRGARIVAVFANERVTRVDIVGQTDGVYLEAPRGRS